MEGARFGRRRVQAREIAVELEGRHRQPVARPLIAGQRVVERHAARQSRIQRLDQLVGVAKGIADAETAAGIFVMPGVPG
ncbi:hypothetical protein D3C83_103760 [compost metagenome]